MDPVRAQYERFPYPPLPPLALPARDAGRPLRFERGLELAGRPGGHRGIRILVAGAGTIEALTVAQHHPHAAEVVALEPSGASLAALGRRLTLRRWADRLTLRSLLDRGLPPLRLVQGDLRQWRDAPFDYILASNVLHHLPDPAAGLVRLAGQLKPGGLLRLRVYSRHSRLWVRETGRWLTALGLGPDTPNLPRAAREAVSGLPAGHPLRSAFRAHGETGSAAGLVDALFHACENPLAPLAWRAAAARAGLRLIGEDHAATSRSDFAAELWPPTAALDRWERLQLLDDLLELSANPVLWLSREGPGETGGLSEESADPAAGTAGDELTLALPPAAVAADPQRPRRLPSRSHWEMGRGLARAGRLLGRVGLGIGEAVSVLRHEVGPHLSGDGEELPGLSLGEYDVPALAGLAAGPAPWDAAQWRELERLLERDGARGWRLHLDGEPLPGDGLPHQAEWLQGRHGAQNDWLGPLTLAAGPHQTAGR